MNNTWEPFLKAFNFVFVDYCLDYFYYSIHFPNHLLLLLKLNVRIIKEINNYTRSLHSHK